MRLTKLGHACVRLEHDGTTVVLDPGAFTGPGAAEGADLVLITHVHPDHWTVEQLRRTEAPIRTIAQVAEAIRAEAPDVAERVELVAPGDTFGLGGRAVAHGGGGAGAGAGASPGAGGIEVEVVNDKHAVIHPDYPRPDNSGFILTLGGTSVFHPGDCLDGPGRPVDVLLTPVSAPWLKISEAIDFALAVGAPRNLAIHDAVYTDRGLAIADQHLSHFLEKHDQEWIRLSDGADL